LYAPEWVPRAPRLATTAGMHRFVWPLRYAKPAALAENNSDTDTEGVWAKPGRYTIELSVDGKRLRQPVSVAPDPRVKLADDAYAQQFEFARSIEAAQLRVAAARGEAKNLHMALAGARAAAGANAQLTAAIDALDKDVVVRAGIIDAGNSRNAWALPAPSTTSLRFIGETFGNFAAAAASADAAPTPDARAGYAVAIASLDKGLAEWTAFTSSRLSALNAQLRAARQKPISIEPSHSTKH
jgi:hypothetical protein